MPVYISDEDTLQDYFEREIKGNNYWIEPIVLSEWIYGYNGDEMLQRINPEVFTMIDEAKKITPNYEVADIVTELFVVVNKLYNKHLQEDTDAWMEYYEKIKTTEDSSLQYLQEE